MPTRTAFGLLHRSTFKGYSSRITGITIFAGKQYFSSTLWKGKERYAIQINPAQYPGEEVYTMAISVFINNCTKIGVPMTASFSERPHHYYIPTANRSLVIWAEQDCYALLILEGETKIESAEQIHVKPEEVPSVIFRDTKGVIPPEELDWIVAPWKPAQKTIHSLIKGTARDILTGGPYLYIGGKLPKEQEEGTSTMTTLSHILTMALSEK